MVLGGFVYDITNYVTSHPGGVKSIMSEAGKDGTAMFSKAPF